MDDVDVWKFSISPFKYDFSQIFKSSLPKVGCHGIIAIALLMYGVRWGALFLCFEMTTAYVYDDEKLTIYADVVVEKN